jgi:hypothetical protein
MRLDLEGRRAGSGVPARTHKGAVFGPTEIKRRDLFLESIGE